MLWWMMEAGRLQLPAAHTCSASRTAAELRFRCHSLALFRLPAALPPHLLPLLPFLQTVHDGRIYTLKIYCDENYPDRVGRWRASWVQLGGAPVAAALGSGAASLCWRAAGPAATAAAAFPAARIQHLRAPPTAPAPCHPAVSLPACLQPPQVRFYSRVQMSCVAPNGVVDPRLFHVLGRWNRRCGVGGQVEPVAAGAVVGWRGEWQVGGDVLVEMMGYSAVCFLR